MTGKKIFAAFSKDVEEDVTRFGDFLCSLNAQCKGIEFSVFKSEKELCEALELSKEKIGSELDTCEYFLLILGGKNDEHPLDKLKQAIANYMKTRENPAIHIFINNSIEGADANISLFASGEYEHFVEQFSHNDTLKAKFMVWLSAQEKDFAYEVDTDNHGCPVIKINGRPVSGLVDFDAFLNNEDYQDEKKKLLRNKSKREEYIEELRDAEEDEKNDLWDDISALTKEIEEQQDKITAMEKDTLALYQNYAKKTLESGYNSRLKKALDCIERGELERAKRVLDPEGSINNLKTIANENELLAAKMETNKNIAMQEINILFAEIDRLKLDTQNVRRFEEIEKCYANIEKFQEKLGLEMTVLVDYANYLHTQKKHGLAIEKFTKELFRCRKLAEKNPDEYLPYVAGALNSLVVLQRDTNRLKEAGDNITEALAIYRKLAENNPGAYLPDVASALNNLAGLQRDTSRYNEAEANYTETIKIRRKLAEADPEKYLPFVAWSLNSFAVLQKETNNYKDAEESLKEAINIRRKLADKNPDAYLPVLAWSLNSLVVLQRDTNRLKEAEDNITEALAIYRKLAEINPDAYLPEAAMSLNNLAGLKRDTNKRDEAQADYTEVISIRRKLAETNPESYLPDLAWSLNSYAVLQKDTGCYKEAEDSCIEALAIRRKLTQTNPEKYTPLLIWSLNCLADLYSHTNREEEAEEIKKEISDLKPVQKDSADEKIQQAKDENNAVDTEECQKAAESGDGESQIKLAVSYMQGKGVVQDYAKAVEWLEKAAAQGYSNAQCYLGICYKQGVGVEADKNKAIDWYKKALETIIKFRGEDNTEAADIYNDVGSCYNDLNEFQKAIDYCGKALDIRIKTREEKTPETGDIYNNLGIANYCLGQYDAALDNFNKGMDVKVVFSGKDNPDAALSYFYIAGCYEAKEDKKNACKYFNEALKIYQSYEGFENEAEEVRQAIKKNEE
ncbi:MAG: tetratricopeptide repeat protein [Treponema sp.]|nr:tetratricopeptide repeat protein [Treponema sp.]